MHIRPKGSPIPPNERHLKVCPRGHDTPESHTNRDPGFVDLAMLVMEAINGPHYNVHEQTDPSGASVFSVFLKDEFGRDTEMVAVVTYNPRLGSVLVQQTNYPRLELVKRATTLPLAA